MRDVPNDMIRIWQGGDFTGPQRPMARVTVQQAQTQTYQHTFPIMAATTEEIQRRQNTAGAALGLVDVGTTEAKKSATTTYASTIFGSPWVPMELPNVKSVTWNRSVDQDVAEANFEFYNSAPLAIGDVPIKDELGFYTFNRGSSTESKDRWFNGEAAGVGARWGHEPNEWANMLMPDNILRTYEGYGFDPEQYPERDTNLVQTGVWIIDQVDYGTDGIIRVTARDPARLLMDHIAFLPVVPPDFYPLSFKATEKVSGEIPDTIYKTPNTVKNEEAVDVGVVTDPGKPTAPVRRRVKMSFATCSDRKYDPSTFNYTVVPRDYLIKIARRFHVPGGWREIAELNEDVFQQRGSGANYHPKSPHWIYPDQVLKIPHYDANQYGHEPTDAFDHSSGSYWLSRGFTDGGQGRSYATEWIEGKVGHVTLSQVRFTTGGSGYAVYVSVRSNGKWIGASKVPYKKPVTGVDLDADIPYVKVATAAKSGQEVVVTFDKPIPKVDRVRLTFKNLALHDGRRCVALRNMSAYANTKADKPGKKVPVPPGYRGVTDSFNRRPPGITFPKGVPTKGGRISNNISGLGKTKQGDTWNAPRYTIKPRGTAVLNPLYTGHEVDGSVERFYPATLNLGVRQQAVTIHTDYHHSSRDDILSGDGRWCIALRGDRNCADHSVRIMIEKDGALSVYLHTPGTGLDDVFTKITDVPADGSNFETKNYEVSTSLIGNELMVATRIVGSSAAPIIRLALHDKRFADFKGTYAGFALNGYSSQITYFKAQTRFRRGVHDSFTRKNAPTLGRAETGQTWRHPDNTWKISSNDAKQVRDTTATAVALVDMYDSDQDVVLDLGDLADGVVIALRASDTKNLILVRLDSDEIRVEARVNKVTAAITSADRPSGYTAPFLFRAKIIEGTVTVYLGERTMGSSGSTTIDWEEVLSDTNLAYTHEAFGYHTGFGAKGEDARVREFTGTSLGADDTWVYEAETVVPAHFEAGAGAKPGTYEDYTDIVKLLCAWGGFYWPKDASLIYSEGSDPVWLRPQKTDPVLGYSPEVGRVWGDFENSGTAGPTPLDVSIWDKKTLMDGITYVREILGFLFHIDETGGVIWRQPNIFAVGNNVASFSEDPRRTGYMYTIDETQTLLNLRTALNSRNVRERIFIANVTATQAGMASGFNPNPTGLRRVAGWTDQHFASQEECQVMADLIALRQLFRYRTSQITISALPAIQIDDQIRIWEEITSEGGIHYVRGVSSTNDLEGGNWSYDLETHWLGEDPFTEWAFDSSSFPEETQAYMDALRGRTGVGTTDYYELPRKDTDKIPYIAPSPDGATQLIEEIDP